MEIDNRVRRSKRIQFGEMQHPRILLPEIWTQIFERGSWRDFRGLLRTSRWGYNLFYQNLRECDLVGSERFLSQVAWQAKSNILRKLSLHDHHLRSKGFSVLDGFQLEELVLSDVDITDNSLAVISELLPDLRSLRLTVPRVTDEGIMYLTRLRQLRVLSLIGCRQLTEKSFPTIGRLTSLVELHLGASQNHLLQMDRGRGVEVQRSNRSNFIQKLGTSNFEQLSGLTRLIFFDTGPFVAMTPMMIDTIAGFSGLQCLKIYQGQLLDEESLQKIGSILSLTELHLYKCKCAGNFSALTRLTSLRSLDLRASLVDDQDLGALVRMPSLIDLNISNCPKITDRGLESLLATALSTQLSNVSAIECKGISEENRAHWTIRNQKLSQAR